jgi:DNA repair exonuclease SbcCD ATPase subunit
MAEREARRAEYINKLDALEGEVSSLNGEIEDAEEMIDDLDAKLDGLPNRIQRIRRMNYKVLTYLEKDQASLVDRWTNRGPSLKENVRGRIAELRSTFNELERALSRRRRDPIQEVPRLRRIESRVEDCKSRVSELNAYVSDTLSEYENRLQNIEQDLNIAEATVDLMSQASFPWKEGESPILAVKAKDVNNDVEGILTLTNQRFIFESEKEIVLKKTLFIATEKKKVREVVIDQPIGMIDSLTKGRIGFFAGQGLFITFKPQSRLKEMKFDTKGYEADWMLRFYNFIVSGEAEKELAALQGDEGIEKGVSRPLVCEICGAPYTDEVYRGQTSVQCKYCGSVIPVTQ